MQIRKKGLRDVGSTLAAEPAHRIATGAETLALRMDRSSSNALALAQMLEADPHVAAVHYPGLPVAPAARAGRKRLFASFGGLLSSELKDGIDCFDYLNRLKVAIP